MFKKLSNDFENFISNLKKSPIFSYWRVILFGILTIILIVFLYLKFDFVAFWNSVKLLSWQAFVWLALLSIFEQVLSWERYKRFLSKSNYAQINDYITVATVGATIPPKPLGLYYRFVLSTHLFKTKVKETAFLIAIDTAIEGIFIVVFAIFALFLFPQVNLGLEVILYLLGILGILYLLLSYYETRIYLVTNGFFKKIILYLSKFKKKIIDSFFNYLKNNLGQIIIGSILTIIKMFVGVLKVYLLFLFFGLEVSFWVCFGIWSIAFFVANASSLPGGLGAFELSFVYLSKSVGIPEALALNVAIMERIFAIWLWALFSGIYLFIKHVNLFKIHDYFVTGISNIIEELDKLSKPARKIVKKISKDIKLKTKQNLITKRKR